MAKMEFKDYRDDDDDDNRRPVKPEDLKKLERASKDAMTALKEALESKNEATAKNVEKFLADVEEKNAKFARETAEWNKKQEELADAQKKRIDDLELHLATKGGGGGSDAAEEQKRKNFLLFAANGAGAEGLDLKMLRNPYGLDTKTMRTDSDTAGGYLVPPVMEQGIRKAIVENSPVRPFARVRALPGKSVEVRRRLAGHGRALYQGELRTAAVAQSKYGMERVTTYRQTETVEISRDLVIMSPYNVEAEIYGDAMEAFGLGESYNFLFGTGDASPKGIMVSSKVALYVTAGVGAITPADLSECASKLKRGQKPWWFFNRRTLAKLQQMVDSQGRPLWQMPGGDQPATIYGFPYSSDWIDLDNAQSGSNSYPIVFGDMLRGYEVFDTTGTEMIRDDVTKAGEGIIRYTWNRWNTGDCLTDDSLIKLKIQ